jgi:hypothetical protein
VDLSAGSLFASLLVSTVGLFLFLYGKKTLRFPQLSSGLVLMIFPYFVPGAGWMLGIAGAVLLGTWALVRAGA